MYASLNSGGSCTHLCDAAGMADSAPAQVSRMLFAPLANIQAAAHRAGGGARRCTATIRRGGRGLTRHL